ncbi:MAG TPA: NAD(P)-dependent oxidoreductase [Mycobacterium sp.]|nr:NAD(P)-dependent oxidoreductase [Mycobacterium sp.]
MTVGTILITGAFGQIGKRCAQILLDRGRTVIATDLRTDKTVAAQEDLSAGEHPEKLIPAYIDLLDAEAVRELVVTRRPEAIIHLAAIVSPPSYRNPELASRVNVGGTENLLAPAASLPCPPLFLMASSAAVYGSLNPFRHPERITPDTPVDPIDQYGQDKVLAEAAIRASGLPYALLRLGGVVSPDTHLDGDYLLLIRATPRDNRIHAVDARDVALAFANGADREATIAGKVLLIGGNESYVKLQRDLEDDMMAAVGLGRLGPSASLPGDPDDDRGWAFTGWFDTTESQALLDFQEHDWHQTVAWIAESLGHLRTVLRALGPILRPAMRTALKLQRRAEGRGPYAEPWTLIEKKYGSAALAD